MWRKRAPLNDSEPQMTEQHSPTRHTDSFVSRHIGPDEAEVATMLSAIGVDSIDQLLVETVPDSILVSEQLDLAPAKTEREALAALQDIASAAAVPSSSIEALAMSTPARSATIV